ncbi:hypothetical protein V8C26DRAFT_387722 [Trichoderma gracile]
MAWTGLWIGCLLAHAFPNSECVRIYQSQYLIDTEAPGFQSGQNCLSNGRSPISKGPAILVTPKRHIRGDSYGQSCMTQLAYHSCHCIDSGNFSYRLVRRKVHHRPEVGIKRCPLVTLRPFALRPGSDR